MAPLGRAKVAPFGRAGVAQLGRSPCLAEKAFAEVGDFGVLGDDIEADRLDRDVAMQRGVESLVDLSHRAAANLLSDPKPVRDQISDVESRGHLGRLLFRLGVVAGGRGGADRLFSSE